MVPVKNARAVTGLLLTAALGLSLSACGGDDGPGALPPTDDSAGTPSTAPATPVPSTVPTPTRSVEPPTVVVTYGPLTLTVARPADAPATAAPALRAYTDFEQRSHKMYGTNVDDPGLAQLAGSAPLKMVRDVLAGQVAKKQRTGGRVTATVKVAKASTRLVLLTGCYDQSRSLLVRANGSSYRGPLATKYPKLGLTVTVARGTDRWQINEYSLKEGTC